MGKSSLLIWCGNLILQKDLRHVYLILRNLLYLIIFPGQEVPEKTIPVDKTFDTVFLIFVLTLSSYEYID